MPGVSLRKQVFLAPSLPPLSLRAGAREQALTQFPREALPGEDGEWACADPCLPRISDLFPLIFPSGKWTALPQRFGMSSPRVGGRVGGRGAAA